MSMTTGCHAKVDRAAREAEQLAKLQQEGKRSATDIAPEPVNAPQDAPAAPAPADEGTANPEPSASDQGALPEPAAAPAENRWRRGNGRSALTATWTAAGSPLELPRSSMTAALRGMS